MNPRQQQTASSAGKSENGHKNRAKQKTNLKPRKLPNLLLEQKPPICLAATLESTTANKPS